ncbi:hypothetical protein A2V95_03490 [Candidatus Kuenenbacteria bacterium RBG_16_41_7]|uniref:Carboxypeptidase regulatory-like domain-containing protein n=1 Tax=Candidatus Kuenenbacteria bacterium RBG_16_41_7 TaxID=1798560 RepID=A0A1F6GC65_9BACT|nr:MAG: hypothetical protein A2V95_03490 [Candidatus Kuenenbacteria bacterium RBG_16_41_7]
MKLASNLGKNGFSLIEILFVIVILAVSSMTLYSLLNMSLKMLWENKARVGATELANEKLEIARNLPYNSVGTIGGVVAGTVPENETVARNGIDYNVYTNIVYIDDEFDGTWASQPADILGNDYKRILVRVSWHSNFSASPVEFYSDVAPKGIETTLAGGTLVLTVFNISGLPVGNANVHIYSDDVVPIVDMNTFSNAQGKVILPAVKAANEAYEIAITKSDYSSSQTYDTTVALPAPDKPHLTVFEGQATSASFSIDQTGDMFIYVKDINGLPLGNFTVHVQGQKRIGLDGNGEPVLKFNEDKVSNASGVINMNGLEWDNYEITVASATGYDINEIDPPAPVALMPLDSLGVNLKLEPTAANSLIVAVKDVEDTPVEGASVRVTNNQGYDKTIITGSAGQVFFTPLSQATTTVAVTKSDYEDYSDELQVSGYTYEPVIMVLP